LGTFVIVQADLPPAPSKGGEFFSLKICCRTYYNIDSSGRRLFFDLIKNDRVGNDRNQPLPPPKGERFSLRKFAAGSIIILTVLEGDYSSV